MDVRQRVQITRLIELIDKHPEYAKQLGLEKASVFHRKREKTIIKREEQFTWEHC